MDNSPDDDDDYYDLDFWVIMVIGTAAGIILAIPMGLLLFIGYRFW